MVVCEFQLYPVTVMLGEEISRACRKDRAFSGMNFESASKMRIGIGLRFPITTVTQSRSSDQIPSIG
jgi:hypothetical protein